MKINENNSVWKFLKELSTKKGISEITINGENQAFIEKDGEFIGLNVSLPLEDIFNFSKEVCAYNNEEFNESEPIFDGILPDGSRINIIAKPFVKSGIAITIRKYLLKNHGLNHAPSLFDFDPKWLPFFRSLVSGRFNVIISGGTSVGKTTLMNMLISEIGVGERLITIEDTLELNINRKNYVALETSSKSHVTVSDLVKNSLRMKPDRIFIGEVRGKEAFDLMQAMNTGHEGSMSTIHANSAIEALTRLETLYMMSGYNFTTPVVRSHISSGVDFIIQLSRDLTGKRFINEIVEIGSMEGDTILFSPIFERENGVLNFTGIPPAGLERMTTYGELEADFFE